MHKNNLEFGCMHENKTYFCVFGIEMFFESFWIFLKFQEKLGIFNTESVFYNISLQLNIRKNYWKYCYPFLGQA
jgi:hypothetical protein